MPFLALTGAPFLRGGVKLNVMAIPQVAGLEPDPLAAGERLSIRFGHCCPTIEEGEVAEFEQERLVLTLGSTTWTLKPAGSGVTVEGIVSADWLVCEPTVSTH